MFRRVIHWDLYCSPCVFGGSEDNIKQALENLANEGSERGLLLRKDKYELSSINDLPSVDDAEKRKFGNHFNVLGAALGSKEFLSS